MSSSLHIGTHRRKGCRPLLYSLPLIWINRTLYFSGSLWRSHYVTNKRRGSYFYFPSKQGKTEYKWRNNLPLHATEALITGMVQGLHLWICSKLRGVRKITGYPTTGVLHQVIPKPPISPGLQPPGVQYQAVGPSHYISAMSRLGPHLHKHWDD